MTSESVEYRVKGHNTTCNRSQNTRKHVLNKLASAITPAFQCEQKDRQSIFSLLNETLSRTCTTFKISMKLHVEVSHLLSGWSWFIFIPWIFAFQFFLFNITYIYRGGDGGAKDVPLCDKEWFGGRGGQCGAAAGMSGGFSGRGSDRIPHAKSAWPRGTHRPHLR